MNYEQAGTLAEELVELFRDPDDLEPRIPEVFPVGIGRIEVGVKFWGTVFTRELDIARGLCEMNQDIELQYRIDLDPSGTALYIKFYSYAPREDSSNAGDVFDVFAVDGEGDYIRQDEGAVRRRQLFHEMREVASINDDDPPVDQMDRLP